MRFCTVCGNMYYIRLSLDNANQLVYYCRNCGNEDTNISQEDLIISSSATVSNDINISSHINRYTKFDPTLPRVDNILCPNADCSTNTHQTPKEIIQYRYDDVNMRYVNICSTCDTTWKVA
jgi:DNA-directed RNA polymerase subunit M/transcription elongation factor TFIIS